MQSQKSLGDQVRQVADQLQKEKNLQIKATSRILGAAAQISKNYDQLLDEVVCMAEKDLIQGSQKDSCSVEILKNKFGTLREAKLHFGLKASSWKTLAQAINTLSSQSNYAIDNSNASIFKRLDSIEGEIQAIHTEIRQILSLLTQTH
jgi:hypothetical protein